jgi:phosphoglycolate phosphatase-like HAD superfamily hydrolase
MKSRLLLFDIDGTLISTHGIPRTAMGAVLQRRYDNFNYNDGFNFSGRTDWEIIEHLLRYDNRQVAPEIVKEIMSEFVTELEIKLNHGKKPHIFPGVIELLNQLAKMDHVCLGLVTGNISKGAYIKLSAADLLDYFPVGSYGDDARHRSDLPPIAISRAEKYFRQNYDKNKIWIIGDSIHDVSCARDNGLRALAVSTGWTDHATLAASEPDYLVADLSDVPGIIDILTEF